MKFVWAVRVEKTSCVHEHFKSAWEDFKSHDTALIYPKLMSEAKWNAMSDFSGW